MRNSGIWGGWKARAAFLALLVALLALTASAQTSSTTTNNKTAQTTAATPAPPTASMGQRVFIDPKTHQPFQPSPEDIKALENAGPKTKPTQSQPKAFSNPRGGVAVKLDDSFMSYEVATKDVSGKATTICVEGADKAQQAMKSGKSAAPKTTTKEALDEK
jgi:hypothetical protein